MKRFIAGVSAEEYPPEQAKFRAPLLWVHGVWSGAWCWQSWATHFCNLGWDPFAIDLRRRSTQNPSENLYRLGFGDCVQDLANVIRSFPTPPVLLAMNLGALMALKASEQTQPSALILVSPLPENLQTALTRQTAPDSGALVREFLAPRVSLETGPLSCPILALSGSADEIMPAVTTKRMADWLGGDF